MRAMILERAGSPLTLTECPTPAPGPGQVLIRVRVCGVCRTDLHVADGELTRPKLPLVLGHEVVGRIEALGTGVEGPAPGTRVGVPWLAETCGRCRYCRMGKENLCERALFTGFTRDGGYGEFCVADARFVFPLPEGMSDAAAAPLLCAGLIGYRALVTADRAFGAKAGRLGLYGFGAAAHIVAQVARFQGRKVYAFTRPGDQAAQALAASLGAVWVGGSDEPPPDPLEAAIIFAPVGALVPAALEAVDKGGAVVAGGIHMSDIPAFPYRLLWEERSITSVANLTRQDAREFLALAPQVPVRTTVVPYRLEQANEALADLRSGAIAGAAVLVINTQA